VDNALNDRKSDANNDIPFWISEEWITTLQLKKEWKQIFNN
jgi:hypothetical protein